LTEEATAFVGKASHSLQKMSMSSLGKGKTESQSYKTFLLHNLHFTEMGLNVRHRETFLAWSNICEYGLELTRTRQLYTVRLNCSARKDRTWLEMFDAIEHVIISPQSVNYAPEMFCTFWAPGLEM